MNAEHPYGDVALVASFGFGLPGAGAPVTLFLVGAALAAALAALPVR